MKRKACYRSLHELEHLKQRSVTFTRLSVLSTDDVLWCQEMAPPYLRFLSSRHACSCENHIGSSDPKVVKAIFYRRLFYRDLTSSWIGPT